MQQTDMSVLIGVWVAAFLTLCIYSFLFRDNPFYKFAEHLFVGVSAGYWMVIQFEEVLVPNLFGNLGKAYSAAADGHWSNQWSYLIPAALGVLLVLRLVPSIGWVSRWPLAFLVGLSAGYGIVIAMDGQILKQTSATILPLWTGDWQTSTQNFIVVAGVLASLVYFYFSVEHRGVFGGISRIGIFVLMISFGASFGYTVMARVSILIGRLLFFKEDFWPVTQHFLFGGGGH